MATGQAPDRVVAAGSPVQITLVTSSSTPSSRQSFYLRRGKRGFDLIAGIIVTLVMLPLVAAAALAVLATSGRPVFYGSERSGRGGRRFQMWKFRTMVADADAQLESWKDTHPHLASELSTNWKLERDPRVTALGRFLRKSSLDELPQLWNVLRGEMSIVGPRPYLPRETMDATLAEAIHAVQPGLTGPFQVRGRKGLSPKSRMEIEAAYGADISFLRDLSYIARTVAPLIKLDGE